MVFIINNIQFNSTKNMEGYVMDWNIILYVGLTLIVSGFLLFLHSEKKLREIDRKIAENDRFIQAMLRAKK